jgi:regulator of ribonuclease activity A
MIPPVAFAVTDLCDRHGDRVAVAAPALRSFGGLVRFCGPVATVRCFEDNSRVRERLEEAGEGRVLVVDGAGSLRCALVGGMLAELAVSNGWSGVVVNGCVRDTLELARCATGMLALAANPRRSDKRGEGECDVAVAFAGVQFRPGDFVYADADGLVVSRVSLLP